MSYIIKNLIFIICYIGITGVLACSPKQENATGDGGAGAHSAIDRDGQENESLYDEAIQSIIQRGIDTIRVKTYFADKDIREYLYKEFVEFYETREHQLAWYTVEGAHPQVAGLIEALENAPAEGLAFDYKLDTLQRLRQEVFRGQPMADRLEELVRLDFLTTSAYLTYASHLLSGVVDPNQFDATWLAKPREKDLAAHLEQALEQGIIRKSLAQLLPQHRQYHRLKEALATYQTIAQQGGWPVTVPMDTVLQVGDTSNAVISLRERLFITGDLAQTELSPAFDGVVEAALRQYQQRNGLLVDGIFGPQTAKTMNTPVGKRIRQIQLNIERLRWWPASFGNRYVMVNIPEFKLRAFDNREKKLEMKVIVGEEYTSTPILRDHIEYIEFSPTWTVPLSIARKEFLPALKKDSTYLERRQMKLYSDWNSENSHELDPRAVNWKEIKPDDFSYRIVQQPGSWNALGLVKFMFPNRMAIYLHDTPTEYLFDEKVRAFSHGCVRVERPVELAEFLLQDKNDWNRQRIQEHMHLDTPAVVHLSESVPVQFLYQTAFVDDEGLVNFRADIYGHDQVQLEAIPVQ